MLSQSIQQPILRIGKPNPTQAQAVQLRSLHSRLLSHTESRKIRKKRQLFVNLSMAGLDRQSEWETVTLPKVMADAIRGKKKREVPNNQPHERPGQPFSIYIQISATQVPYSGVCIFSTLLKLPSET